MDWEPFLNASCLFGLSVLALWGFNSGRKDRHRQVWLPPAALLLACVALWLYIHPHAFVEQFLRDIATHVSSWTGLPQPVPPPHFPFYLNEGLLALFALVKIFWRLMNGAPILLGKAWRFVHSKFSGRPMPPPRPRPSWAYHDHPQWGIVLKDDWVYTAHVLRWTSALGALLLVSGLAAEYASGPGWTRAVLPMMPGVPLLLLLEMAWYLGGSRPGTAEDAFSGDGVTAGSRGSCEGLWDVYHRHWPDRILAAMESIKTPPYPPGTMPGRMDNAEFSGLVAGLNRAGFGPNAAQCRLLKDLWERRDVLVSCECYDRYAPFLFACLQRDVLHGRRVLVVNPPDVLREGEENRWENNRTDKWISRWMARPLYAGLTSKVCGMEAFQGDANILEATVNELMECKTEEFKVWLRRLGTVIVLNVQDALFQRFLPVTALFRSMEDQSDQSLQFISLTTERRITMEDSVRDCLTAEPEEYTFRHERATDGCCIFWKLEGEDLFQQAMFAAWQEDLGAEPVLALPAYREGVSPIYLIGLSEAPWWDTLDALQTCESHQPSTGAIKDVLRHLSAPFLKPLETRVVAILRDDINNPAASLLKSMALGSENVFSLVVCTPHMLREYFTRNMDFFLQAPLSALTPRLRRQAPRTAAYVLLEQLLRCDLSEDEVRTSIHETRSGEARGLHKITQRGLATFLECALGLTRGVLCPYIEREVRWLHDPVQDRFKEEVHFFIRPESHNILNEIAERPCRVLDEDQRVLTVTSSDHVHQQYLPGQMHAFGGKHFLIESVSADGSTVFTRHQSGMSEARYRRICSITLDPGILTEADGTAGSSAGGYRWRVELLEASFTVRTLGYYSFLKGIDLREGAHQYEILDGDAPLSRSYKKGRALRISIARPQGGIAHAGPVSLTLALLLNELFPTLLPESCHFLLATAAYRPDSPEKPFPGMDWRDFVPLLNGCGTGPQDSVEVLVLEDSTHDLGALESLRLNALTVFEVLEDYLVWCQEEGNEARPFLGYGEGAVPQELMIEETLQVISWMLSAQSSTLRKRRKSFDPHGAVLGRNKGDGAAGVCDFCGEALSPTAFEELPDGRQRCSACAQSAVNTLESLKKHYEEARAHMCLEFGIQIRRGIEVQFADAAAIQAAAGRHFVPTSGFDARAIGLAVKVGTRCILYIENGQPYHMTFGCLAHEMTHVWQHDNLDFAAMMAHHGNLLVEGHAVWVETACLTKKGIGLAYCEMERARTDEYGRGYRLVEQLMKDSGKTSPFEFLRRAYRRKS